jgi:predicted transposase YdaD
MAGALKESSTYQKILREGLAEGRVLGRAEGRIQEVQAIVLRIGTRES